MKRFTTSVDDEIGTFIDTLVGQYGYYSRSESTRELAWKKKAKFEIKDNIEFIRGLYYHTVMRIRIEFFQ